MESLNHPQIATEPILIQDMSVISSIRQSLNFAYFPLCSSLFSSSKAMSPSVTSGASSSESYSERSGNTRQGLTKHATTWIPKNQFQTKGICESCFKAPRALNAFLLVDTKHFPNKEAIPLVRNVIPVGCLSNDGLIDRPSVQIRSIFLRLPRARVQSKSICLALDLRVGGSEEYFPFPDISAIRFPFWSIPPTCNCTSVPVY